MGLLLAHLSTSTIDGHIIGTSLYFIETLHIERLLTSSTMLKYHTLQLLPQAFETFCCDSKNSARKYSWKESFIDLFFLYTVEQPFLF